MSTSINYVVAKRIKSEHGQGIPFMFDSDDFRLVDPQFASNFEIIGSVVVRDRTAKTVSTESATYRIFSDRSLKEI